jgi:hypothetical protein
MNALQRMIENLHESEGQLDMNTYGDILIRAALQERGNEIFEYIIETEKSMITNFLCSLVKHKSNVNFIAADYIGLFEEVVKEHIRSVYQEFLGNE